MGEAPISLARFPNMKITFDINEEQLENLEDTLLEAKENFPDNEEEFLEADADSPVGTVRVLLDMIAAKKTPFGLINDV